MFRSLSVKNLDQFGQSCGRGAGLSHNETGGFHEPGRHRHDETALEQSVIRSTLSRLARDGMIAVKTHDCAARDEWELDPASRL